MTLFLSNTHYAGFLFDIDGTIGKPDPQCYLVVADRLGLQADQCLVFEDVEAGVQAGQASGADVLVVTTDQGKKEFADHSTIPDYTDLAAGHSDDGLLSLKKRN